MANEVEFPSKIDPAIRCVGCTSVFEALADLDEHVVGMATSDTHHWYADGLPVNPAVQEAYDAAMSARDRRERFVTKLAEVTDLTEPEVLDILRSI